VIGRQLAALRHASGLTQEQLAERARVSVDVIRRLEQGQRRTARFATLYAIAAALDTEVSISFAVRESGSSDSGHDQNGSSRGRNPGSSEMKRRELLRVVTSATAVISLGGPADLTSNGWLRPPDVLGGPTLPISPRSMLVCGRRSSWRRTRPKWVRQSGIRLVG
jgi:transcriptional regulator with XRE-family HTH domain